MAKSDFSYVKTRCFFGGYILWFLVSCVVKLRNGVDRSENPLYSSYFDPERHNFWSVSQHLRKLQKLTIFEFDWVFKAISRFQNVRACTVLISRNSSVWLAETAKRQKFSRIGGKRRQSLSEAHREATHSMLDEKIWCTLILMNVCHCRHASPTAGHNPRKNFVSYNTGEQA